MSPNPNTSAHERDSSRGRGGRGGKGGGGGGNSGSSQNSTAPPLSEIATVAVGISNNDRGGPKDKIPLDDHLVQVDDKVSKGQS